MKKLLLTIALGSLPALAWAATDWQKSLQDEITRIDNRFAGDIGVYVQEMGDGASLAWQANQSWYLGTLTSIPVAVEVLDRIDRGELALNDTVTLDATRIIEGPGETSQHEPGTSLSVAYLLEQMLAAGDQTAADMLIGLVGLDAVNQRAQQLLPPGQRYQQLGPITRPLEMHRNVFGIMHRRAFDLNAEDFRTILQAGNAKQQVQAFQQRLNIGPQDLKVSELGDAYALYYATPVNSGQLDSFAQMLATIYSGQALTRESTDALLAMLRLNASPASRLGAGLPDSVRYAHQSSRSLRRMCDAGIVSSDAPNDGTMKNEVIVAACVRGPASDEEMEKAFNEVGKAIAGSGVLPGS